MLVSRKRLAGGMAACALAMAGVPAHAEGFAVSARVSTLGLGIELTKSFTETTNGRLGFNSYSYDYTGTESDIRYKFDLGLRSVAAMVDWHPFAGGFRLSAGVLSNGNDLSAQAEYQATYNIGGTTYTAAQVGTLRADIDFDSAAPYLGVGWGNAVGKDKRLGVVFDLGVMYQGTPKAKLSATGTLASDPTFQANLAAEQQELQNAIDDFKYYLVVGLGLSYQF